MAGLSYLMSRDVDPDQNRIWILQFFHVTWQMADQQKRRINPSDRQQVDRKEQELLSDNTKWQKWREKTGKQTIIRVCSCLRDRKRSNNKARLKSREKCESPIGGYEDWPSGASPPSPRGCCAGRCAWAPRCYGYPTNSFFFKLHRTKQCCGSESFRSGSNILFTLIRIQKKNNLFFLLINVKNWSKLNLNTYEELQAEKRLPAPMLMTSSNDNFLK